MTAVELGRTVLFEVRDDGVVLLTIDDRAATHNTITPAFIADLAAALDGALAAPNARALVLRSGKADSFLVGANIDHVRAMRFACDAEDLSREVAMRFARLGSLTLPVVAYVDGPALGGGFEMALACTATVATEHPKTAFGLPDVNLGLIPAASGLFRISERAGLRTALDLGLTGRSITARKALSLGLVDEIVPAARGLEAACALALRLAGQPELVRALSAERRRRSGHRFERALLDQNPLGRALLFRRVRSETLAKTRGHVLAAERVIDLLATFGARGFRAAAELESRFFGELAVSEAAHRSMDLFLAQTELKKDSGLDPTEHAAPLPIRLIGVLGIGRLGAEIAVASTRAGYAVRTMDTDDSFSASANDAIDSRGLGDADLVIEALFEDLTRKRGALRDIEKLVRDTCVVAPCTSSIPISQIADGCARPEKVVGLHYSRYVPIAGKPLLEVVRTSQSDPDGVAAVVAVGKKQGKMVIVVRDGPAFYTTRIIAPYLEEAARLLEEGCSIDEIDAALVDWGFPMGPFQLRDQISGEVASPPGLTPPRGGPVAKDEISLRCALAMVNEVLRCHADGTVRSARDGDVGAVFGVGFPAFRGGPLRYVDVLGAPEVLRRMRSLEQRFGARFEPAPLLVEMARGGRRFYG